MLRELHIRDFALIKEISIEFGRGFNVLTGETGAGKSIIIDALAILLGGRVQSDQLRSGASQAIIEGIFDPPYFPESQALMEGEGLPRDPEQFLIIRRHVLQDGKSKAYVNGILVSLSLLRSLGDYLADIQGQQQSQSLLQPRRQLELLDAYAGHQEKVNRLQQLYQRIQKIDREREDLRRAGDIVQRKELLGFQWREIEGAHLTCGEEGEITGEKTVLANAEKLFQICEQALGKICDEPGSALDSISYAMASLKGGASIDARLASILETLQLAVIQLKEAVSSLKAYQGKIDFDPGRLEELEMRISAIAKLKRKYGATIPEILAYHQQVAQQMEELEGWVEKQSQLSQERQALLREMEQLSLEISRTRREAAISMGETAQRELHQLGMPRAIFQIAVTNSEDPAGELMIEGKRYQLSPRGIDGIEFLFSSNPGEKTKPLSRIISGGELSRVVLALKTVLAALDEIPTLVLDEVDAGISGSMAEVVGKKLSSFGNQRQVLCITHLSQIAAFGEAHFQVQKGQQGGRTLTKIKKLNEDEKANEIARMLGSKGTSKTPLMHAREILSQAIEWRRLNNAPLANPKGI
jgi:DNA repair protein RecN (Recombination protein N)